MARDLRKQLNDIQGKFENEYVGAMRMRTVICISYTLSNSIKIKCTILINLVFSQ